MQINYEANFSELARHARIHDEMAHKLHSQVFTFLFKELAYDMIDDARAIMVIQKMKEASESTLKSSPHTNGVTRPLLRRNQSERSS
jgi:hypothetical protein